MSRLAQSLANSLAQSLSASISGGVVLPFSLLTFARNSAEYILYNGVLTRQATVNTPATRTINGRVFMQSEPAVITESLWSESFVAGHWSTAFSTTTEDATTSPLGDSTGDFNYEDTANNSHRVDGSFTGDGSSRYVGFMFLKAKERVNGALRFAGTAFPGVPSVDYILSPTVSRYALDANADFGDVIECPDGWVYVYFAATSDAAAGCAMRNYMDDGTYTYSYLGDGASGMYLWGGNVVQSTIVPSYVFADAAPGSKPKVDAYYAEAVVPAWMRNRFYFEIVTNHFDSAILALDGGEKHLWSFDPTAGGVAVRCYMDGGDGNKIKVDLEGTGNIITTAATTPTWDGKIKGWFTFDNGANSVLRIDGAGIDAEYTGVQLSAADGNVYWGQNESAALQPSCLISQPELF